MNGGTRLGRTLANISDICCQYYPFMKTWKILLPAGWMVMGVRYLFRVMTGKRQRISGRQFAEVQKRESLYKELHLFESE